MTERTVRVRLSAQAQSYIAEMEKAAKATRETGSAAEKLAQQRDAFQEMGRASMLFGAAAAAGVGLAASKFADFDAAMSNVQAATHESADNMKLLSDAALEAGARTVFSAEESANAIEELAKAGVSTADIISGGLDGALDLAAAGGLGVAEAAGIAATALKTFNLEGSDMSHVADLLAAGAGKAMGDVTDLSAALNQSAMVANATGLSIEETTAALSAFASQGLLGSDAGTSFKSMLQSLTPSSAAARDEMDRLGITAYDAQGDFVGLTQFAGSLEAGLRDLTVEQQQAALKTIFGSDAIRAATVLYSEGEKGIRKWMEAVDDQGYAAETAAARLNNLKGDLEALGGALDTALIETGSAANETLRGMVQWVTAAIDLYNELPAPLQGAAMWVGIATSGVGLLTGALMVGIPKYAEFKVALDTLNISGERFNGTLKRIGQGVGIAGGVAAVSFALDAFRNSVEAATVTTAGLENTMLTAGEASDIVAEAFAGTSNIFDGWDIDTKKATESFGKFIDQTSSAPDMRWMGSLGTYLLALDPQADKARDRFEKMGETLAGMDANDASASLRALRDEYQLTDAQMTSMLDMMPDYKDQLIEQASSLGLNADEATLLKLALRDLDPAAAAAAEGAERNAEALAELQGKAEVTTEEIDALADAIREMGSAQLDVREASRQLEDSVAVLNEKLVENGLNLDITTEAGRQTEAAIDDMAKSVLEHAAAIVVQTGDQEAANAALENGRNRLIGVLEQFGMTREEARRYVDQLGLIPGNLTTDVYVDTSVAMQQIQDFINNAPKVMTIQAWVEQKTSPFSMTYQPPGNADGGIYAYAGGGIQEYADGGFASGIYKGGAPIHKFAEPETIWEAYISGKPSERDRNRQIWVETGNRLGMHAGTSQDPPIVYVQNPWTGEYLLAKAEIIAETAVDDFVTQTAAATRRAGL